FSWCVGGSEGFMRKKMINMFAFWYGSRMQVRSGSWWCEIILDLDFVDDKFMIRNELAIELCGLRRNEPE
ncbi:hypothetical protein VIGAN_02142200, partial [Vigna angularis var. angularis]